MTETNNKNIQAVHVGTYDLNGIWRGKRIPMNQVEKTQGDGVRLPMPYGTNGNFNHLGVAATIAQPLFFKL